MNNLSEERVLAIAFDTSRVPATLSEARALAMEVIRLKKQLRQAKDQITGHTLQGFMPTVYGNQTQAAKTLQANRSTIRKFLDDVEGNYHRVINGRLFTVTHIPEVTRGES